MSEATDDLILTPAAGSSLNLPQWLRFGAAAGGTRRLDPDGARLLACQIEGLETRARALALAVATLGRERCALRAVVPAMAALHLASWAVR